MTSFSLRGGLSWHAVSPTRICFGIFAIGVLAVLAVLAGGSISRAAEAGKPLEAPQTEVKEVKLAMWKFLTALGKSVSASISVLNAKAGEEGNGEGLNRVGWNFGDRRHKPADGNQLHWEY